MTKQADLIAYVFDGQPHPLGGELLPWMESSPRFTAFMETYRDKTRKKMRLARDPESILDVRSELEVAARLLGDRRLALAYEPYASAKRRGPDFAVTYRDNLVFNLEAARLRGEDHGAGERRASEAARERAEERLLRILLDKLGQMMPGMPNLLAIQAGEALAMSIDLGRLMQDVKTRVDKKDPSFYAATRYPGPAAFYKDFLRLSGILLWASSPGQLAAPPAQLWANKQARPALAENVLRLIRTRLSGAGQAE